MSSLQQSYRSSSEHEQELKELINELTSSDRLEETKKFLQVEWSRVFNVFKQSSVTSSELVDIKSKNFTELYGHLFALMCSGIADSDLSILMNLPTKDFSEAHYTVITEVTFGLTSYCLACFVQC